MLFKNSNGRAVTVAIQLYILQTVSTCLAGMLSQLMHRTLGMQCNCYNCIECKVNILEYLTSCCTNNIGIHNNNIIVCIRYVSCMYVHNIISIYSIPPEQVCKQLTSSE